MRATSIQRDDGSFELACTFPAEVAEEHVAEAARNGVTVEDHLVGMMRHRFGQLCNDGRATS